MKPEIGYWYTFCCEQDLQQITTPEDLQEVAEYMTDEYLPARVWKTKEDALDELKGRKGVTLV